jgi:hypothetical protein
VIFVKYLVKFSCDAELGVVEGEGRGSRVEGELGALDGGGVGTNSGRFVGVGGGVCMSVYAVTEAGGFGEGELAIGVTK